MKITLSLYLALFWLNFSALAQTTHTLSYSNIGTAEAGVIQGHLNNGDNVVVTSTSSITILSNTNILKSTGTDATLTFKANFRVTMNVNTSIQSTAGKLNIVFWSNATDNAATKGMIRFGDHTQVGANVIVETNGGHLWMGGGANDVTWNGITVGDSYAWGSSSPSGNGWYGIELYGDCRFITSGGDISLNGRSTDQTSGQGATFGIYIIKSIFNAGSGQITTNTLTDGTSPSSGTSTGIGIAGDGGFTTTTGNITITNAINVRGNTNGVATGIYLERNSSGNMSGNPVISSNQGNVSINTTFTSPATEKWYIDLNELSFLREKASTAASFTEPLREIFENSTSTYSSSATSVATVTNSGLVSLVSVGTADITGVLSRNDWNSIDSRWRYRINVVSKADPDLVFAESEVFKQSTDANFTLTATQQNQGGGTLGAISYTTSNRSVATVNESTGEVTIVGEGSTIITATSASTVTYAQGNASYILYVINGLVVFTTEVNHNNGVVSFSGNVVSDGGSPVIERGFVYSTSPTPTISDTKINLGAGTGSFSGSIGPLGNGTYYFRAYATNGLETVYGSETALIINTAYTTLQIGNVDVNEGSDWAVFTISGPIGDVFTLNLMQEVGTGKANLGANPTIETWNGTAWVNYVADAQITIPASGIVYARVDITNEQDSFFEGAETFQLEVVPIPADVAGLPIYDANFQSFTLDSYTRTGTDGEVNTTYLKTNAITIGGQAIDVLITIKAKVNVSSFTFDSNSTNPERFQPQINSSSSSGSYVDFVFDFFESGTSNKVAIKNFVVNPVDVDGNSSTNKEFIELFGISSYQLGSGSGLTVIENPPGRTGFTRFEGIDTSLPGVTFDNTASFIAFYSNPVATFESRMGVTGASSSTRLFSMSIGSAIGTFDNPSTTDLDPILGTATIFDDGTGDYWIGDNLFPATSSELITAGITLDDDRSPGLIFEDVKTAFVNEPRTGNVATNDQMPAGTTYSALVADAGNPSTDVPVLSSDGSYTFTTSTPGVYTFTYDICAPGVVAPNCEEGTLIITVLATDATDAPPVANTDFAVGIQGSPVVVKTLANDDAGTAGVALIPSSVTIVIGTEPDPTTVGSLSVNTTTGDITFTPVAGFVGTVSYAYQVCDTNTPTACATATQTVTIYPTGSPNIVVAADDYNLTYQGASIGGNVLSNDSQVKAGTLTATPQTTTVAGIGTFELLADGSYTFVPDPAFTGNTSFVYEVTGVDGVKAYATVYFSVAETPTFNYIGGGDPENWCDPENWDKGTVPSTAVNVTIKSDATNPNVKLSGFCDLCINNLDVQSGASLEVDGIKLCVTGDVTSAGLIDGTGSIHLKGTTLQTISGDFNITNLELENTAGAVITPGAGNMVQITESLKLTRGTLTTNSNLRLMSDADGDAYMAPISDAECGLVDIIGSVRIQKFVAGGNRAFRFISHPFDDQISLQQIRDYVHITGQGLDFNDTGNPSAFWYNTADGNQTEDGEDSGWVPVSSTNIGDWFKGRAVRMMFRGPRTQGGVIGDDDYNPSVVTYELIGEVNFCEQILTGLIRSGNPGDGTDDDKGDGLVGSSAFNFIGNPFPAAIDLKSIPLTDRANLSGAYYLWQPRTGVQDGSTVFGPGGGRGGNYVTEPFDGGIPALGQLASGTGFFVFALVNNASIRFTEANKLAQKKLDPDAAVTFREDRQQPSRYGTNSLQLSLTTQGHEADRVLLYFDEDAYAIVDRRDATKFANPAINFFTVSEDNYALAIDHRPWVDDNEYKIPLFILSSSGVDYTIKIPDFDLESGRKLFLVDRMNLSKTEIKAGMEYTFKVTDDPKSKGHRFDIVMGVDVVTSLETSNNRFQAFLLPNPAQEQVRISIQKPDYVGETRVRIVSIAGVEVRNERLTFETAELDVDLGQMSKGIYLVEITHGTERIVKRLIVK